MFFKDFCRGTNIQILNTEVSYIDERLTEIFVQALEGQPSGFLLGTVHAKDPDEGENGTIFYSMSGEKCASIRDESKPDAVS